MYQLNSGTECGGADKFAFVPPSELLESPRGRDFGVPDWGALGGIADVHSAKVTDVCIVGGGLAAVMLASELWHAGVDFIIVDPHEVLTARIRRQMRVSRQRVMRSPYEHHVACQRVYEYSLLDYAKLHFSRLLPHEQDQVRLATAGHRGVVPVDVFVGHLWHVIAEHDLRSHHLVGGVKRVDRQGDSFVLTLSDGGRLSARHVVMAQGERERDLGLLDPRVMAWSNERILDLCDAHVLVVGSGQTAANTVHSLISRGCRVAVASRSGAFDFRCVDSTPSHFRPARRFDRSGRGAGGFPPSVMHEYKEVFEKYESSGVLTVHREPLWLTDVEGEVRLEGGIRCGIDVEQFDYIVPCVGLVRDDTVEGVPVTDVVDFECRRADGVFVIGAAARPAVGPVARNIDGHRVAAERICHAILDVR